MELTHFDEKGNARMVDVSEKKITSRTAVACGTIRVGAAIFAHIQNGTAAKGDVLNVARIAGIMAAKRTGELIPMCHPLMLTKVTVDFTTDEKDHSITAVCTAKTDGKTGVEMEALTGVQVALLTIYDMCKAVDKGMVMTDIHLMTKAGGKSGDFTYTEGIHEAQQISSGRPLVLAVSGYKNSGKTTLICRLTEALQMNGFRVAVIKHDGHCFSADVPGTDSFQHFSAGAEGTFVFDDRKYMLVQKWNTPFPDPETLFPEADLIFLEGFKKSDYPKIELGLWKGNSLPELSDQKFPETGICNPDTVWCYVSDISFPFHRNKPVFSFENDGFSKLLDFITAKATKRSNL